MICRSDKNNNVAAEQKMEMPKQKIHIPNKKNKAFTLVEVAAGIVVLTIITGSVIVGLNRYLRVAADEKVKMRAFELARENMEQLLNSSQISDFTTYGFDNENSQIEWQKTVTSFYEPLTSRMWIKAISGATYTDNDGNKQTIELEHWLTNVSKQQMMKIVKQSKLAESFQEQSKDDKNTEDTENTEDAKEDKPKDQSDEKQSEDTGEMLCGYPMEQLNQMTFEEVFKILWECHGN